MIVEIVLARHGETQNNKEGILQGQLDIPLNEKGLKDAEELAAHLKEVHFDAIYSSYLLRARQCAQVISDKKNFQKINISRALAERHFGEHQGSSVLGLGYPDITYPSLARHFYECDCPGGESRELFIQRIDRYFDDILNRHDNQRVLTVTHGGVVMFMVSRLLREEIVYANSKKHSNGFVSYFKLDKDKNVLDSLVNVHVSKLVEYLGRK